MIVKNNTPAIGLLITAALLLTAFSGCSAPPMGENDVLQVNGQNVTKEEFSLYMAEESGNVLSYYYTTYGAEKYDEAFWNTDFGDGDIPVQRLREKARERVIRNSVILKLAKDKGLIDDTSYSYMETSMQQENQIRKEQLANGEPVYGVTAFTIGEYYDYRISQLSLELQEMLFKKDSDKEKVIQTFYEEKKEELFYEQGTGTFQILRFPVNQDNLKQQEQIADEVHKKLCAGESLETVALPQDVTVTEEVLDQRALKSFSAMNPKLMQEIAGLDTGEISGVILENSSYAIAICQNRDESTYQPLEEVKSYLQQLYKQERFEELVEEKITKAKVTVNQEVYNTMTY